MPEPRNFVSAPAPGYYRRKLVRNGPWVAARIWVEDGDRDPDTGELLSDQTIRCEVGGSLEDAMAQWSYLAGQPITEAEYRFLLAQAAHAGQYETGHPAADPTTPIDLAKHKPLF